MELVKLIQSILPTKFIVKNISNEKSHDRFVLDARRNHNKIYVLQKNKNNFMIFAIYGESDKEYLVYYKDNYLSIEKEKKSIDEHKTGIAKFLIDGLACCVCKSENDIQICGKCCNTTCRKCVFSDPKLECLKCNDKYEVMLKKDYVVFAK